MLCDVNFADWSAWEGHGSWVPLSTLGYPKSPKSCGAKLRNSSRFVTRKNYATSPPLATVGPWAPMLWLFSKRSGKERDGSGTGVGREWDGSGTEVGGKWDTDVGRKCEGSGMGMGREWDGSGTEVGREWDGSWTEVGRKWVAGQFSLAYAYALPVRCGKKNETKSRSPFLAGSDRPVQLLSLSLQHAL